MAADSKAVKAIEGFHKGLGLIFLTRKGLTLVGILILLGAGLYFLGLFYFLILLLAAILVYFLVFRKQPTENSKERKPFFTLSPITIIILLIIVAFVAYNWENLPSLIKKGEVAGTRVTETTGVRGFFANQIANVKEWFSLTYGFKQPKVEEKQPSGIKIKEFTASKSYFEEGQPVVTRTVVHIDALPKDDASIRFWCESEGNQGKISISRAEGDTITLQQGKSLAAFVVCKIERGLNAGDEKSVTRKIKLTGEYENFATKTALNIYTLAESSYEEVGTEDPFDYFGVEEPLLSSNNIIKPQCVSGCGLTLLSLKVSAPQPLTQLSTYFLDINLQKDRDWYGEINKVNEIKLLGVPESVQLINCDPEISVEGGQTGDPIDLYVKTDLTFSCEFEVINPDVKLGDYVGQFIVEANYNYAVISTTTVDIRPKAPTAPTTFSVVSLDSDILSDESPLLEVLK